MLVKVRRTVEIEESVWFEVDQLIEPIASVIQRFVQATPTDAARRHSGQAEDYGEMISDLWDALPERAKQPLKEASMYPKGVPRHELMVRFGDDRFTWAARFRKVSEIMKRFPGKPWPYDRTAERFVVLPELADYIRRLPADNEPPSSEEGR